MTDQISVQELAEELRSEKPPRLLDVREPEEHELAALPGSTLVPLGQLLHRTNQIAAWKNDDVVVYCHHGIRSRHAIETLQQMGFRKLRNLTGGIDAWSREIDPSLPRY